MGDLDESPCSELRVLVLNGKAIPGVKVVMIEGHTVFVDGRIYLLINFLILILFLLLHTVAQVDVTPNHCITSRLMKTATELMPPPCYFEPL